MQEIIIVSLSVGFYIYILLDVYQKSKNKRKQIDMRDKLRRACGK